MSLVGSEVDVSRSGASSPELSEMGILRVPSHEENDDLHPPVSPKRAVEKIFLDDLETQTISAAALAQQLHQTHRSGGGYATVATEDYQTAVGDFVSDHDYTYSFSSDNIDSPFNKDALALSREPNEARQPTFYDTNMKTSPSTPSKDEKPEMHVDAAEKVYDTAKNVWTWGKGIVVFRPFLGLAEAVAGKVVSVAGSSLESVDTTAKEKLHGLDDKYLNPAIAAVVSLVLGVVSQTESTLKPILISLLKPVGLIKEDAENPEMTPTSGVTVSKD